MQEFSIEAFAAETTLAMTKTEDRMAAARSKLEGAITRFGAAPIIEALEAAIPPGADIGEMIVHLSGEMTLLYARVPPRFQAGIHDHTVFALIAPLRGREVNRVYVPGEQGLRQVDERIIAPGEIFGLAPDAIHEIENPARDTMSSLHLYGGDFRAVMADRSLYRADTGEREGFTFDALLAESVTQMQRRGNRDGLRALAEAIPASVPRVQEALRALTDGAVRATA